MVIRKATDIALLAPTLVVGGAADTAVHAGTIEVQVDRGWIKLPVPMGTQAEYRGQVFAGPCSAKVALKD